MCLTPVARDPQPRVSKPPGPVRLRTCFVAKASRDTAGPRISVLSGCSRAETRRLPEMRTSGWGWAQRQTLA